MTVEGKTLDPAPELLALLDPERCIRCGGNLGRIVYAIDRSVIEGGAIPGLVPGSYCLDCATEIGIATAP